jgi:hypothetical protein
MHQGAPLEVPEMRYTVFDRHADALVLVDATERTQTKTLALRVIPQEPQRYIPPITIRPPSR